MTMEERRLRKLENDSKYPRPQMKLERIQLEDGRFALKITDRYLSSLGRRKGHGGKSIEDVYDIDLDIVTILETSPDVPKEAWGYAGSYIDRIINGIEDTFKEKNKIPRNVILR